MSETGQSQWQLCPGEYLGEISALCLLHLPPHISCLPLLLSGTGSQVLVLDLSTGKIIRSFQVFKGIRVHGICLENFQKSFSRSPLVFRIAVFGEKRVKLFNLQIGSHGQLMPLLDMELAPVISLPKFGHWVMDVCFLREGTNSSEDARYVAIGCSDNSVYFWDITRQKIHSQVTCSERCLLYSMRMYGNQIESLTIASGTIFNEIVVWKVVLWNHSTALEVDLEDFARLTNHERFFLSGPIYEDAVLCRLVGHEGSIFRIAWFSSGKKLVSVSDDRSARIWEVPAEDEVQFNDVHDMTEPNAGPVLFGHNARIWDCCTFDSLIITASEDCSCRIWDEDGRELKTIKEHIGRGVWRCLCDPNSSLLVTAGFDSAIRVHQVFTSSKGLPGVLAPEKFSDPKEVFAFSLPNYSGHDDHMDSKSEYVRCLHLSRQDSIYVATNNGYLYHVNLVKSDDVIWTELAHVSKDAPIICMDLLSNFYEPSGEIEDWIALGDGNGNMTIVLVVGTVPSPKVELTFSWQAEKERHLLDVFWFKSLQTRFVFSANPCGRLRLWKLCDNFPSASRGTENHDVLLISEYASCFGMRIMCMDASYEEELLVCGDIRGNLLLYSLPRHLLGNISTNAEKEASQSYYFKGAHGVSSVTSVSISSLSSDHVEIRSTGADGCICYLQRCRDQLDLEFMGMKQVKELSAIRSFYDLAVGNYAVGFASANFTILNLTLGTKVLQITCGGWRRPHSFYVGHSPEIMNCFSFVKDDVIYVHRNWVPENDQLLYPRNIHFQFHGREIHSLCFVSQCSPSDSDDNQGLGYVSTCIATGCEDGTMRLTRCEPGTYNWLSSELLGVHVGGSAVRAICAVSDVHMFVPDSIGVPEIVYREEKKTDPFILISVGAKRVVTAWKQIMATDDLNNKINQKNEYSLTASSTTTVSSFSFQWLSTDMPLIDTSYRNRQNCHESLETAEDHKMRSKGCCSVASPSSKYRKELDLLTENNFESDCRCLTVTAFRVKEAHSRISVCFVVIASSDATITLKALVLPFCLWFDVASLASSSSPVLTVQHVVIPKLPHAKGNSHIGNLYFSITGSTDGSIAFWDLTESVENFMKQISGLQLENRIGIHKRPRTGRGSQGGRWWRSLDCHHSMKKTDDPILGQQSPKSCNSTENCDIGTSPTSDFEKSIGDARKDSLSAEPSVLAALHVLDGVHQSGVNCLHVSDINDTRLTDSTLSFYVVSGGDDQAINCLRCILQMCPLSDNIRSMTSDSLCTPAATMNNQNPRCQIPSFQMKFVYMDKMKSAHSSAVKGIWTDGIFVFSIGLDQRVRCWSFSNDKLTECAHLTVSVPEPEALDVKTNARNHYQIAVAGRGIQMVQFSPSSGISG